LTARTFPADVCSLAAEQFAKEKHSKISEQRKIRRIKVRFPLDPAVIVSISLVPNIHKGV
jgi:hypothetical protein